MTKAQIIKNNGYTTKKQINGSYEIIIDNITYTIENLKNYTSETITEPWQVSAMQGDYYYNPSREATKIDAIYYLLKDLGKI